MRAAAAGSTHSARRAAVSSSATAWYVLHVLESAIENKGREQVRDAARGGGPASTAAAGAPAASAPTAAPPSGPLAAAAAAAFKV